MAIYSISKKKEHPKKGELAIKGIVGKKKIDKNALMRSIKQWRS